jgi:DNA-binding transcriptional LysR family regulator
MTARLNSGLNELVYAAAEWFPSGGVADMNWGAFDLNLLIVFDAVMQERSVTRAAGRIGLSQPAVSHALGRLRHMLKDELFIRTPEGMMPTPRAEQLADPLRRALNDMQLALEPETFVPAQAARQFVVAVNNNAAVVLASPLLTAVTDAAPGIQLDLRPSGLRDMPALLDRGELDVAIGTFDDVGERFAGAPLLEDSFVVAMRCDHPAARRELTPQALAGLSYLEISSSGEDTGFVDDWLGTRGLTRSITHRAPRLAAAAILSSTDLVAVLSRRLAEHWVQRYGVTTRKLPFASPVIRTEMLWHRRFANQPAHLWLRKLIEQTAESR